ncbi:CPBP family intramembrane metalloprotease [Gracilibacillus salitolerans]|uniref:CPBP family intramembrane metalloprotease n=1 Tax=Gracilibacillus salitolerans TaxID=2663022 RepID=A0A5Q2TI87_9BACI|nr:CPBP family intramembrane glutamic endopeptidase [Gracilibacillus salitolerans]QGH33670.1 CPBP family intramembrane metalloprotease [Gracilibacillus salitolerans]
MKWILLLIAGWITITGGLFLGALSGNIAEQFGLARNYQLLIQGLVMSGIVVPIILYLYRYVYRLTGEPNRPVYSWKSAYHFFTGALLAIGLATFGFIIATSLGWITIEQWHTPDYWFAALLINMVIAFLYEALPEELALRGMVYDVLRYRFAAWLAVLLQTILFLLVPLATVQLQVFFGLSPGNTINAEYIVLISCFGICLQLLRLWTQSLWTSIGFHLAYLEITRVVVMPSSDASILSYNEVESGLGTVFIALGMIIIGGIIFSLFILGAKRFFGKGYKFNKH